MSRLLRPPLLVCVDFQREYTTEGRPLYIADAASHLIPRAERLLDFARAERWLIAHALMHRDDLLFGGRTEHVRPLPGFEPFGSEMIFQRAEFSVFNNAEFGRLIDRSRGSSTLMMGLGGPFALLHTAMDAHARRHEVILIDDVLGSPQIGACAADQVVAVVRSIAGAMHRLITSTEILERAGTTGVASLLALTNGSA